MAQQKILKVGLTGGIGSGKSTVADYFAKLGVPIIDADQIVSELLSPNTEEFDAIVTHFGDKVLSKRGELKRKYLRRVIFNNPLEKKWLEKLLHPRVFAIMRKLSRQVNFPYCILAIPLLFECKMPRSLIDKVLVVDASEKTQIKRIIRRDKISIELIKQMIASQIDRKSRLKCADDVIVNEGSLKSVLQQVQKLHEKYLRRMGVVRAIP